MPTKADIHKMGKPELLVLLNHHFEEETPGEFEALTLRQMRAILTTDDSPALEVDRESFDAEAPSLTTDLYSGQPRH